MTGTQLTVRKTVAQVEEIRTVLGQSDEGGPLRRVVVAAVLRNPYAGRGYVEDLTELIEASEAIGTMLGEQAVRLLGAPVASYGKAGLVGNDGEQEHINAALTSVFGDNFAYTDSSELEFGIKSRSFKSFRDAAIENNWARFYGGIHFHNSCIVSTEYGRKVGDFMLSHLKMKK